MTFLQIIGLLIKYGPIIKALLKLIRDNSDKLDINIARPDTEPEQDIRDLMREIDEEGA